MHRFGVLVPSSNTTVEEEYGRLLPTTLQVHVARIPLLSSGAETTPRSADGDVDYQARLLGCAKVEVVALVLSRPNAGSASVAVPPSPRSSGGDRESGGRA
jgi:maleate cis-trans isomerase